MKVLVTGGAGYIGSFTVAQLLKEGHQVVVLDNLVFGHKKAVDCPLVVADLINQSEIEKIFKKEKFEAVIHFAAYSLAGVSMDQPYLYFKNNILGGLNLLETARSLGVKYLVFSSTAAVYGYPKDLPVTEKAEKVPTSVYGESKLAFEKILAWYDRIYGVKSICLRYFNACGAALDGSLGEDHDPESHLIPLLIKTALGQRKGFSLFGNDYPTKDGTCVRDYIHVLDLAQAHLKALEYLKGKKQSNAFNLGTGRGYSNLEVIKMVKKITKVDFPFEISPARPGDPAAIWADNRKAKRVLGWSPQYSDLETIVKSAFSWHQSYPQGFGEKK